MTYLCVSLKNEMILIFVDFADDNESSLSDHLHSFCPLLQKNSPRLFLTIYIVSIFGVIDFVFRLCSRLVPLAKLYSESHKRCFMV